MATSVAQFTGAQLASVAEMLGTMPTPLSWGIRPDGKRTEDAAILANSTELNSVAGRFHPNDVGKGIRIDGAGAAGSIHRAIITEYVSPTRVILDVAAAATVASAYALWGTDVGPALNAALAAMAIRGNQAGALHLQTGIYVTNQPINVPAGVALVGVECSPRYGHSEVWRYITTTIAAGPEFPASAPVIDARQARNTGFYFLEVVGNGTANYNATDASSRGLMLGSAERPDDGEWNFHTVHCCSFVHHEYGVWNKLANGVTLTGNNIASNWRYGVYGEKYAFNDRTHVGNMINSNYWLYNPTDLLAADRGIGLYLGYGCAHQCWVGGKVEWNAIGVKLDKASFAVRFNTVSFDANAAVHALIIGQHDKEDILTESSAFHGCQFMGGSYAAGVQAGGQSAHIVIVGQKSDFEPVPVTLSIENCNFKATKNGTQAYWSVAESGPSYPNKFPKDALVRCITTGEGDGRPTLRLSFVGNDCFMGAVRAGAINIAGTAVSWVAGDQFLPTWRDFPFFHFWFNEYTIDAVSSPTSLTLKSSTASGTNQPYHVSSNAIVVSDEFSGFSEIVVSNNVGVSNFCKKDSSDHRDLLLIHAPDVTTMNRNDARVIWENSGRLRIRNSIHAHNLEVERDVSGALFVGRYDGGGVARIIAGNLDSSDNPSRLNFEINGAARASVVEAGLEAGFIGINAVAGGAFRLDLNGNARMLQGQFVGISAKNRPAYIDVDGWLTTSKIKINDLGHMDVSGLSASDRFLWNGGSGIQTAKVNLQNGSHITLGGMPEAVVLAAAGDVVSFYTLAGLAGNIQSLLTIAISQIPGLQATLDALGNSIADKADADHTHSEYAAAGHSHN